MSVIVIVGGGGAGGGTKPENREVVPTEGGAEIVENGQSLATFTGPNAIDNAIKYLKVMKG